jgi:hypothetical protein
MLKKIHEKYGVLNKDVSGAEVYDALVERFPHLTFHKKLTSNAFNITTRSGIAKLTVMRGRGDAFLFQKDISFIYQLMTLGLINLLEGLAGRKDMADIRAFLRERFHISQKA